MPPKEKTNLHPRNRHRHRYDFKQLKKAYPELTKYLAVNKYGDESIDFSDPLAVKALNAALLKEHYQIENWDIPQGYLCAPVPGRADYIHYVADVMASYNHGKIPKGKKVKCLDIGVGANCIYPIIGIKEYGWTFIGAEINPISIKSANQIIANNPSLKDKVEIRLQKNPKHLLAGIIQKQEKIELVICNPPFYSSEAEANAANLRKLSKINNKKINKTHKNFGGQNHELWCEGGERKFIKKLITESKTFADNCKLFSSLVSKETNLKPIQEALKKVIAKNIKTIQMSQGNKKSHLITWTF